MMREEIEGALQEAQERIEKNNQEFQGLPGSDMVQMRIRTKEKIMNYLMKNAGKIQKNEVKDAVEETEVKIDLHDTELESKKMKIEKFNSEGDCKEEKLLLETSRLHELEEELRLAKEIISILSAAVKRKVLLEERISSMQRRLHSNGDEQLVKMLQRKFDELSSGSRKFWSKESGALSSALANEMSRLERAAENSCRLEQEKNILESQATVDKQSIKELKSSLEIVEDTIRKLHEEKAEMLEDNIELKRRKIEVLNENTRLTELMALRAAENESNVNTAEKRMIEAAENSCRLEQEKNILESQAAVDKQSIKELKSSLEMAEDTIRKLHEEKAEMLEENIELKRRKIELLNKNTRLTELMALRAAESDSNLKTAEKKIIELQDKLELIPKLRKDMELQTIELIEANVTIDELTAQSTCLLEEYQKLFSKVECLNKVEKDQKFIEVAAPRCDNHLESRITFLEGKCEQLILKVEEYESIEKGVTPAALNISYHQLVQENKDVKVQLDALRRERDELLRNNTGGEQTVMNMEENAETLDSDQHQSTSDLNPKDESLLQQNHENKLSSKAIVIDNNDPRDTIETVSLEPEKYFVLASDVNFLKLIWKKM